MKPFTKTILPAASLSAVITCLALPSSVNGATLIVGTKVGFDFGNGTGIATNWNSVNSGYQVNAAGTLKSLDGVTVDGLTLTMNSATSGLFANVDGTNNWAGLSTNGGAAPVEFTDAVTTDILGVAASGANITISLGGLNSLLSYNIYAVTSAVGTRTDTLTLTAGTATSPTVSAIARTSSVAGSFHTFLGVQPNGSNDITFSLTDPTGNNPIISGLLIVAVPEPSSAALLGGFGTLLLLRRRRKG